MRSLLTYGNATGGARHQRDIAWDFIQRKADGNALGEANLGDVRFHIRNKA